MSSFCSPNYRGSAATAASGTSAGRSQLMIPYADAAGAAPTATRGISTSSRPTAHAPSGCVSIRSSRGIALPNQKDTGIRVFFFCLTFRPDRPILTRRQSGRKKFRAKCIITVPEKCINEADSAFSRAGFDVRPRSTWREGYFKFCCFSTSSEKINRSSSSKISLPFGKR